MRHLAAFILTVMLALQATFVAPAYAEARDVHDYLLDMFRAQIAELTDFDDELCPAGVYSLLSTSGVWSCAVSMTQAMMGTLSLSDGDVDVADAQHVHTERLFVFEGTVNLDDECLNTTAGATSAAIQSAACNTWDYLTPYFVHKGAVITSLVSEVLVAGTAGYGCEAQIRVNDAPVGTAQVIATDAVSGTVTTTAQAVTLAANDALELQITDGADALLCDAGTDPRFVVTLYGYWTQ